MTEPLLDKIAQTAEAKGERYIVESWTQKRTELRCLTIWDNKEDCYRAYVETDLTQSADELNENDLPVFVWKTQEGVVFWISDPQLSVAPEDMPVSQDEEPDREVWTRREVRDRTDALAVKLWKIQRRTRFK